MFDWHIGEVERASRIKHKQASVPVQVLPWRRRDRGHLHERHRAHHVEKDEAEEPQDGAHRHSASVESHGRHVYVFGGNTSKTVTKTNTSDARTNKQSKEGTNERPSE